MPARTPHAGQQLGRPAVFLVTFFQDAAESFDVARTGAPEQGADSRVDVTARYSHWMLPMGRVTADEMDAALGPSSRASFEGRLYKVRRSSPRRSLPKMGHLAH